MASRVVAAGRARSRAQQRRRRRMVLGGGVLVLVAAGGGAAWAMSGDGGPSYRLAVVTTASVDQTVTSTGTISSVNQATLSFPVAGQVAAVKVGVGQKVAAGQTVATLATTSLEQEVQAEAAAVASAQQTLARDQDAQSSSSSSDSSSSSAASSSASGATGADSATQTPLPTAAPTGGKSAPAGSSSSLAGLIAAVQAAQRAVIADQHKTDLDADIAAADQAIVAENTACQALLDADQTDATSPSPAATSTSNASDSSSTADDLQACQEAITVVQNAQLKVQDDEDTLAADEATLDRAVSALIAALRSSGTGSTSSAGSNGRTASSAASAPSSQRTASSSSSAQSGRGSTVVTAAQLAADQKQIDAANAQLAVAKQNVGQASLTTPIAGTVASVSMSAGQTVTAGSSTATIAVIGPGQKSVTTTVGIADIDLVKKGERVQVTVDGVSTPLTGRVTLVGVMNTSGTSGTTATYPVTVVLDATTTPLFDGAGVSVAIDVGTASNVLTVPTSAIHKVGSRATVSVYADGTLSTAVVTLGIEGTDRTEIKSGLKAGQRVELAEITAAIPTSSNNSRRFGGAGLGGGGLGGGGLGGGGLGGAVRTK